MMACRVLSLFSRQIYCRPLPCLASTKTNALSNPSSCLRPFSTTAVNKLKEIKITTDGQVSEIEGVYIKSGRENKLLEIDNPHKLCPLCPQKLGVEVKYTDVLILRQFLRPDGCMIPREVTGLCQSAQYKLKKLVHQAQRAGLLSELRPPLADGRQRTSHKSRYKWRKYNVYFTDD